MKIMYLLGHRQLNWRFKSIFMKNFFIILFAFILPLVVANIVIYRHSNEVIRREARDQNMSMLLNTSRSIDLIFKQIDFIIPQIATDEEVIDFIVSPDTDLTKNISASSMIRNIASTNDYIQSIYVYSTYAETIISSSGGVADIHNFKDVGWLDTFSQHFTGTKLMDTRVIDDGFGKSYNGITFIRNLPNESWSKNGALVINVNEAYIYDLIRGMYEGNRGTALVISNSGKIVSFEDKKKLNQSVLGEVYAKKVFLSNQASFIEKVDGQEVLFSFVKSPQNKWHYLHMIPLADLYRDTRSNFRVVAGTTIANILLCLAFALLISKKIYRPIKKLISLIDSKSKFEMDLLEGNEYEFLDKAYNTVLEKNMDMENTIAKLKPIIKEKFFNNLLAGKKLSESEINERLRYLRTNFIYSRFVAMVVQIDDYDSKMVDSNEVKRNLIKRQLIDVIEKIMNEYNSGIAVEMESNMIGVIYNFAKNSVGSNEPGSLPMIAEAIRGTAEAHFPFTVTLGIGRTYDDILHIGMSCVEAKKALHYKVYQGKNMIIDIHSLDSASYELYFYSSNEERKLLEMIKTGNIDEILSALDELFDTIIDSKALSDNYVQQYFIRIINLILESMIESGYKITDLLHDKRNVYQEIHGKETIEDIRVWFEDFCHELAEGITAMNDITGNRNIDKLLSFINDNYKSDISLNDVAEYVGLSPSYVSTIFKEAINMSFVNYLNKMRIDSAKQLILDTQLSINEIGFKVGFNNVQNFYRTFKKHEHMTPGKFRQMYCGVT